MKDCIKHFIFLFLLIISVTGLFAQCLSKNDSILHKKVYSKVEVMPEFPGGQNGFRRYMEKNLQFLEDFGNDSCGLQPNHLCSMIVEPDGSLSNITINNKCDTNKLCVGEKAYFYMLKKAPKWIPGKQNNKAVPVKVNQFIGIEVEN